MKNPREWTARTWLLLIFVPIALAIIVLAYRLGQAQIRDSRDRAVLAAEKHAQEQDRRVLTELCKTNSIIEGLVSGTIALFQYDFGLLPPRGFRGPDPGLRPALINPKLIPAYLDALATFQGWKAELDQQTACERIIRP